MSIISSREYLVTASSVLDNKSSYVYHLEVTDLDPLKPTVLLLHGYLGSSNDFELVIDDFFLDYNVIAFNLRGHGKSEYLGQDEEDVDWSLEALSDDLYNVLMQIIPPNSKLNLAASSLGTGLALKFTEKYEWLVESLFLISPTTSIPLPMWGSLLVNFGKIAPHFVTKFLISAASVIMPVSTLDENQKNLRKLASEKIKSVDLTVHLKILNETLSSWEFAGYSIDKPVFIIAGDEDKVIPMSGTLELHDQIDQSSILMLNQVKHRILTTHPEIVQILLKIWLSHKELLLSRDKWYLNDFNFD